MPFQLSFDYPFWMFVIVIITGIAFASFLYFKNSREPYSKGLTIILFVLRFVIVSIIVFLLLKPFILHTKKQIEQPILIVAHDNSASIALTSDSTFYKNVYPGIIDSLISSLGSKFNIEFYQFGQKTVKEKTLSFTDQNTNLAGIFETVQNNYINRNVGAILLFSDGIYNKGIHPANASESINVPVLAIALGDTVPHPDISVFDLRYNKKVYQKTMFTVETIIRASQLQGKTAIIELFDQNKKIDERKIQIGSDKFSSSQYFLVEANETGYKQLTVKIKTEVNESITTNNERKFFVEVVSEKKRILIWAQAPHPDIAAIRSSLGENFESIVKFGKYIQDKNESYDLLILHQLPSNSTDFQLISQYLETNKQLPVFMIVGTDTDMNLFNKLQPAFQIESGKVKGVESSPTINETFGLFHTENADNEYLETMPPLFSPFGIYEKKLTDKVLFFQKVREIETNQPLISFVSDDFRKLGFIFGTGIWRWRLAIAGEKGTPAIFDQLINKSITYLLIKENNDPLQIFVDDSYNQTEGITMKALLYNKTGELINDTELTMEISNYNNSKVYPYVFAQKDKGYELNAGKLPAGPYFFSAQTTVGNEIIKATGKFEVETTSPEGANLVANHQLLYQIANQSGGRVISKDSLQLISTWLENQKGIASIAHYSDSFLPIINYYWALIILILLLFTEWLLRKVFGSY